ncbi:hypothetical protein AVEN_18035-1 [Araneus ventricosus]|uniref:Uncharacterized protein n=1 Tax=Araneus ventricosus TaxID=182803 RepID=A0A4Y2RGR0_ARAVE|nr:hypothetical protein AVEN_18035-1 [Araneus ventricosus]
MISNRPTFRYNHMSQLKYKINDDLLQCRYWDGFIIITDDQHQVLNHDNTAVFQIGTNMRAIQDLEGKFTGKFSGSTLKKSKPAIPLRDHGIDVLGKIKFGVKDDTKISDCI